MKALAINSSPNMEHGNTALILQPFLEGLKEAGAEVEVVYTSRRDIRPCTAQGLCWFGHPGDCYIQDDMQDLYPLIRAADLWVLAVPLYWFGMPGPLKNLVDRLMPLGGATWERRNGRVLAIGPKPAVPGKVVLISTAGFWGMEVFEPLVGHVREIAASLQREFAGSLLRPHANALRPMLEAGTLGDIIDAARDAGRQLAIQGVISPATLATVGRTLMPEEAYVQTVNGVFGQMLAAQSAGA